MTLKIFTYLEQGKVGVGGEIQLTDALVELNHVESMLAYVYRRRFEVCEKFGFIEATLKFALVRPELENSVLGLVEDLV